VHQLNHPSEALLESAGSSDLYALPVRHLAMWRLSPCVGASTDEEPELLVPLQTRCFVKEQRCSWLVDAAIVIQATATQSRTRGFQQ
jgi:hypothetical protein